MSVECFFHSHKGTVLRDFLLQGFFMNPLPLKLGSFRIFFREFAEIQYSQVPPAQLVLLLPVANNRDNIRLMTP
jgi:hypothetical protein